MIELQRLWNARHGGVYVPITQSTQPNPYLDLPDRDIQTTDNRQLTKINPAFMTRQLADLVTSNTDASFHITSLNPIRPANRADSWETLSLQKFEKGLKETSERITNATADQFRYMAPLFTKKACLKCHAKQGYQLGDIRGGISVTLNAEPIFGADPQRIAHAVLRHAVAFVLVSALLLIFLEQVRRQWLMLEQIENRQREIIRDRTRELEHLATHDPLTGLFNRNVFEQRMADEINRSTRYTTTFSICMLDLDHFKQINDSHGHQTGDAVLESFAKLIEDSIRDADYAARYGGEEFVIIFPETSMASAVELCERLRSTTEAHAFEIGNEKDIHVTASIGVATFPQHARNWTDLVDAADKALYSAKLKGRNNVQTAS